MVLFVLDSFANRIYWNFPFFRQVASHSRIQTKGQKAGPHMVVGGRGSGQTGPGAQRDQRNGGPESGNTAERKIQPANSDYNDNWLAPLWEA